MPVSKTVIGIKYSQFDISGLPKKFVISALKIKTMVKDKKLIIKEIIIQMKNLVVFLENLCNINQ